MSDLITIFEATDNYGDRFSITTSGWPAGPEAEYLYTQFNDDEDTQVELESEQVVELRDALDKHLNSGDEVLILDEDSERAKLELAAHYGLRVKFAYQGDLDRKPVERRLEPDTVEERGGVVYVLGESYDAGGQSEGIRQFRVDRIHGKVTVR